MRARQNIVFRVFMIGVGSNLNVMGRIIVAKNYSRARTLIMIAITEPVQLLADQYDGFADFQQRLSPRRNRLRRFPLVADNICSPCRSAWASATP